MLLTKQVCDVCRMEVEHEFKLTLIRPSNNKEWKIDCLCDGCREAIEAALDARQHITGDIKVERYTPGFKGPYRLDDKGRKVPTPEKDKGLIYDN